MSSHFPLFFCNLFLSKPNDMLGFDFLLRSTSVCYKSCDYRSVGSFHLWTNGFLFGSQKELVGSSRIE